jgi:hypothetical protein
MVATELSMTDSGVTATPMPTTRPKMAMKAAGTRQLQSVTHTDLEHKPPRAKTSCPTSAVLEGHDISSFSQQSASTRADEA